MAKPDRRFDQKFYKSRPDKLPELLEGHEFFAVSKTRFPGKENRTTLFEFRPSQFAALVHKIQHAAAIKVSAGKARLRVRTRKLEAKITQLKVRLRQAVESAEAAESRADEFEAELGAVQSELEKAHDQIKELKKKPRGLSPEAKQIKSLTSENDRVRGLYEDQRQANGRLDIRLSSLQTETERQRITIQGLERDNKDLEKFIKGLVDNGTISLKDVPATSGMVTAGLALSSSNRKVRSNIPVPGSHPG